MTDLSPSEEIKGKAFSPIRAIASSYYLAGLGVVLRLAPGTSECRQPDAQSKELYGRDPQRSGRGAEREFHSMAAGERRDELNQFLPSTEGTGRAQKEQADHLQSALRQIS